MNRALELALIMSADASNLTRGLDDAGRSARDFGDDVDAASRVADDAVSRVDRLGAAAEDMEGKAGAATGALGALSAGFELVGLEQYAEGLNSAAMATDFASGLGQAYALVTDLESLALIRAKAATVGHMVATKASSAAAKAAAAAQWALNVALSANPIGIVIIAVLALVAAVVIAYKKSETFRAICQAVFKAVGGYVSGVVKIVTTLVEFVRDKAPAAWEKLKGAAVAAADYIADKVGAGFERLMAPIRAVIDLVQEVLDKIGSIDFPDMPDLPSFGLSNPFSRSSTAESVTASKASTYAAPAATIDARVSVTVDGSGIVDEAAVGRALEPVLARHALRVGGLATTPSVVPAW